jgi:hypothetical protein
MIPVPFYTRRKEEVSWFGLKSMHVVAKLTIFLGMFLQKEHFLPLQTPPPHDVPFGRNRMGQMDFRKYTYT